MLVGKLVGISASRLWKFFREALAQRDTNKPIREGSSLAACTVAADTSFMRAAAPDPSGRLYLQEEFAAQAVSLSFVSSVRRENRFNEFFGRHAALRGAQPRQILLVALCAQHRRPNEAICEETDFQGSLRYGPQDLSLDFHVADDSAFPYLLGARFELRFDQHHDLAVGIQPFGRLRQDPQR